MASAEVGSLTRGPSPRTVTIDRNGRFARIHEGRTANFSEHSRDPELFPGYGTNRSYHAFRLAPKGALPPDRSPPHHPILRGRLRSLNFELWIEAKRQRSTFWTTISSPATIKSPTGFVRRLRPRRGASTRRFGAPWKRPTDSLPRACRASYRQQDSAKRVGVGRQFTLAPGRRSRRP